MERESPVLRGDVMAALRTELRGVTITPDDAGYDAARRVWNGAIDRRPSAVILCADAEDVAAVLRIASRHRLAVTVRGGGHNVAGRAIRDDALLLDLSHLNDVTINSASGVAIAQGGALWRHVDSVTSSVGRATTGGFVSTTGVGGLTLGGGVGWLMRKHGLACDNLLGASVVLADGRIVTASPTEYADLFWALRGGAGGLGVVTNFVFRTHPLRDVLAGFIVRPADQALDCLKSFRDFAADAPDEFCGLAVLTNAPPLPFLDAAWHDRPVILLAVCWCGDEDAGARALLPLRTWREPLADHIGWMPYAHWQQLQDASAPAGAGYYWKTANFTSLDDDTLHAVVAAAERRPTPRTEIHVQHLGGAVSRIPAADTAFAHRQARFFVNLIGVTDSADGVPDLREGIQALYRSIAPRAMRGIQANFSDHDDASVEQHFGDDVAARLAAIRSRYDPHGLLASTGPST